MTVLQSIKVFRCWLTSIVEYIFWLFSFTKKAWCVVFLGLDYLLSRWGGWGLCSAVDGLKISVY
jgi:hypothetical protein